MTSAEFKQNMKHYLDKCDEGLPIFITRKGRTYKIVLESK